MRTNCLLRKVNQFKLQIFITSLDIFREAVIRYFYLSENRGKSGHLRAEFPVKAGGTYFNLSSRLVQQKINRLVYKVRVKRWGKSSPPRRQLSGQCKPNSMQGEIGNRVARSMVSGTPHLQTEGSMQIDR